MKEENGIYFVSKVGPRDPIIKIYVKEIALTRGQRIVFGQRIILSAQPGIQLSLWVLLCPH